ncbi:egg cell-secreted protein 1.4-like [Malania oleifera]|uniref:egg cell-secreted protein 1.4-like n=1 Tax=Malania oleifera TaxID=397392 RepID=UPI0025AE15E1|nr:egg cell-secreted protein 1.4-like [Malania oleifera]
MAFCKTMLLLLATACCFMVTVSASWPEMSMQPEFDSEGLKNCWKAVEAVKSSCYREIVKFIVGGKLQFGPNCCATIDSVRNQCFFMVFSTLGLPSSVGITLKAYCDPSSDPATAPSPAKLPANEIWV